jgi:hypothetical protein
MIILFYSEHCEFCQKLLEYLNINNLLQNFNIINIHTLSKIPDNITIVPTIIDPTIEAPIEGKSAFEYVINQKYFDHPTNNIDYWIDKNVPKPFIEEDNKALERHNFGFALYENNDTIIEPLKPQPVITNKKTLALLKLKRK